MHCTRSRCCSAVTEITVVPIYKSQLLVTFLATATGLSSGLSGSVPVLGRYAVDKKQIVVVISGEWRLTARIYQSSFATRDSN